MDNFSLGADPYYKINIGDVVERHGTSIPDGKAAFLNGMAFTTRDRDQDTWGASNCAIQYKGGWWHTACFSYCFNCDQRAHAIGQDTGYIHLTQTRMLILIKP